MSAIDQSQMPRPQPGRETVPKQVVGKKGYPFWLGGESGRRSSDLKYFRVKQYQEHLYKYRHIGIEEKHEKGHD